MALKKTVFTPHGFEAIDAYHRVEGVRLLGKNKIKFQLRSYKTELIVQHFADTELESEYELLEKNPIAQAYDYVKTLPEFLGAADC